MSDRTRAILLGVAAAIICGVVCYRHPIKLPDNRRYEVLAENLLHRGIFSACTSEPFHPEIERMPGYPLFMAAVNAISTDGTRAVLLAQALLHGLCVFLLFRLALALTGDRWVAWLAGLGWAVYPFAIYFAASIMTESIVAFTIVLWVTLIHAYLERPSPRLLVANLAVAIFGMYTRPHFFALTFFWIGLIVIFRRLRSRDTIRLFGISAVVLGVALAPWTLRNYLAFGKLIPSSNNFLGYNVCFASVDSVMSPEDVDKFCPGYFEDTKLNILENCDPKVSLEISEMMREKGMKEIKAHPERMILGAFTRPIRLWFSYHVQGRAGSTLEKALRIVTLSMLPFFLLGGFFLWRRTQHGWIPISVCVFLSAIHVMPLHVSSRYSMPGKPIYIFAIAYFVVMIARRLGVLPGRLPGAVGDD